MSGPADKGPVKGPTYAEAGLAPHPDPKDSQHGINIQEILARFAEAERENVELKATIAAQSSEITWLRSILAKQFV